MDKDKCARGRTYCTSLAVWLPCPWEAREDSDWDILALSAKDKLSFKEEEAFMDHICNVMVKTGQAIQLFAYGAKDWHTRHSITPFYQNVQAEAVLL